MAWSGAAILQFITQSKKAGNLNTYAAFKGIKCSRTDEDQELYSQMLLDTMNRYKSEKK